MERLPRYCGQPRSQLQSEVAQKVFALDGETRVPMAPRRRHSRGLLLKLAVLRQSWDFQRRVSSPEETPETENGEGGALPLFPRKPACSWI